MNTSRHRPGLTLALLGFAQLIISIDYNIVYVALPQIGDRLDFSAQNLQWVISAYAVLFGGFLLLGGRASDLLGHRRMFVLGLSLYAISSLLGGLATSSSLLVAARGLQGLGGAFLFPATLSLVFTSFAEGRERNRALSVWAAAGAGGMVLGSLLGGVLTQAFGWAAVFFVNVPLAGAAIVLAFLLIAPDGPRTIARSFDLPGAVTATAAATLIVFSLVSGPAAGWTSREVVVSATVGVVLLLAFILIERHSRDPLMPLRLLRNHNLSTGVSVTFLFMATFGTLLYFLTVYLQNVLGYNALQTGLAYVAPMAAGAVGSMSGGRLATRYGVRRALIGGLLVGLATTVVLALVMADRASYLVLAPILIILNLAQGVVFTSMFAAASTGTALHEQGIASGIISTGQQVGSAVGLAILVAVANSGVNQSASLDGLRNAVLFAAAGIALTVLVAANLRLATTGSPADSQVAEPVG